MAKSILFRTDANTTIGWGHFHRSLALAQMLSPQFNISFAIAEPLPEIREILEKNGFGLMVLPALNYTTTDDSGVPELECDLVGLPNEIAIVVVDGYWFKERFLDGLRKENVRIVVMDDIGKGTYNADMIINHAPGINLTKYVTPPRCTFLLGSEFALLRRSFLEHAKGSPQFEKGSREVLIYFDGVDPKGIAIKTTKLVLRFTPYAVHLIISPSHVHFNEVKELSVTHRNQIRTSAHLDEDQMVDAMLRAMCAIVPADTVLFECMAMGLPVISGFSSTIHKRIYLGLRKSGAYIDAGNFSSFNVKNALDKIETFQSKRIIDGKSGARLINEFTSLADRLR